MELPNPFHHRKSFVTQSFTPAEVAAILTAHLAARGLRVRGKVHFTAAVDGTLAYDMLLASFTGATATVEAVPPPSHLHVL